MQKSSCKIPIVPRNGMGIRKIARRVHHCRRKVRQVLENSEPRPYPREQDRLVSQLGPYKEWTEWIHPRMSCRRANGSIWQSLRQAARRWMRAARFPPLSWPTRGPLHDPIQKSETYPASSKRHPLAYLYQMLGLYPIPTRRADIPHAKA
jgi:hypothetical protein